MLSRLQELRREEETLLRVKAALHDQLRRLRVEELALQSMIRSSEENVPVPSSALAGDTQQTLGQMDNEAAINQTELHLSLQDHQEEEEEEEEEEFDS
ncbi:snRNA-activating protein complex subunit 5 [Neopelma chrysocephalum]|uniref:snRNA-activating protein complex subunit 5 n=1 Tax=Neopelma chrysocephalum TaxID=114329 RepID=UPI000FCD0B92|nr:snRNA-activating protein complex subunit 5 [Neopelma chrysocephalum]